MFPFFTLRDQLVAQHVTGWTKLLQKVERGSTLSNKFWLCCSFFIKLATCEETNLLMLRDKLRVFVSRISPPWPRATGNVFPVSPDFWRDINEVLGLVTTKESNKLVLTTLHIIEVIKEFSLRDHMHPRQLCIVFIQALKGWCWHG